MKNFAFLLGISLLILSCGSDEGFKKTPVDELIIKLDDQKDFTIILADMDAESKTFSTTYKHRYKIITNGADSMPKEELTDWYEVHKNFFDQHVNDLGMEICSKSDGKVEKVVSPPGYSNYVGNARYGSWQTDNSGNSFWAFYGQYAFMSSMIGLMTNPIYRSSYYDYRNNYRGVGQPYYGTTSSGAPAYGTYSAHSQATNPNFHNRLNSNSAFRNKVNSSVSRSTSGSRSSGTSGRSSSRSSGSARRSGGGGK
jgi:uncharacterized membrane protein YgcG